MENFVSSCMWNRKFIDFHYKRLHTDHIVLELVLLGVRRCRDPEYSCPIASRVVCNSNEVNTNLPF